MLDGLLHPHSSIPHVQMVRSIALYTVRLLSRDSCEKNVNKIQHKHCGVLCWLLINYGPG